MTKPRTFRKRIGDTLRFLYIALLVLLPLRAAAQPAPQGSISGTVTTIDGKTLKRFEVKLSDATTGVNRSTRSDEEGSFTFDGLPPGKYHLSTSTQPVQITSPADIELKDGEHYQQPVVVKFLSQTTVTVVASPEEVAEAQVKQEEKQRVLGFLPNYYTSFVLNPAPMTPKLKLRLSLRSIFDPMTFASTAAVAGAEQKHNTFPGYGKGGEGYAKRYGATYADTVSHRLLASAVFPMIFHQDPRYFYKGSGSLGSRVGYAVLSTVLCRADNGTTQPNYSQFAGAFAAAGISNLYRAPSDRKAGLTVRNGFIILGGNAVANVLRELISKKLTSNLPPPGAMKP